MNTASSADTDFITVLQPGETLLWSGKPTSKGGWATYLPGCMGVVFLIMAVLGLIVGIGSRLSGIEQARTGATLWLVTGVVLGAVGIGLTMAPRIIRGRISRSVWGVTLSVS